MNNTIKILKRHVVNALVLLLLAFMPATNVLADNYRVKIKRIGPESATGDIIIRIKPGKNEDDFTGTARVMLVGTDPGTNRGLATLLTAISLNAEVFVNVSNPPSFGDIQIISSMSMIAP